MTTIYHSKENSVRGYQIPEDEDAVEAMVRTLKDEGIHCSAHPGPTILIATGLPHSVASPLIAEPGSWVTIDENNGGVWHFTDDQFQSQFEAAKD